MTLNEILVYGCLALMGWVGWIFSNAEFKK